jgi:hypothetical protein
MAVKAGYGGPNHAVMTRNPNASISHLLLHQGAETINRKTKNVKVSPSVSMHGNRTPLLRGASGTRWFNAQSAPSSVP